jgi:hypothetical protein
MNVVLGCQIRTPNTPEKQEREVRVTYVKRITAQILACFIPVLPDSVSFREYTHLSHEIQEIVDRITNWNGSGVMCDVEKTAMDLSGEIWDCAEGRAFPEADPVPIRLEIEKVLKKHIKTHF